MCGRFINTNKINKLKKIFDIKQNNESLEDALSYNIAPSNKVNIIINNTYLQIEKAEWGIKYKIPSNFHEKQNQQYKTFINSRLETITEKILFKESFFKKRCLIPANGWYEWAIIKGKKIPHFIEVSPQETMYFAGIWKFSNFKLSTNKTFSIITKTANKLIYDVHIRMPVILTSDEAMKFMEEKKGVYLKKNFISTIEEDLNYYPVSKYVNSPLNDSKTCIKPVNIKQYEHDISPIV